MKQFAAEFYSSAAWRQCREAYKKSVKGLCENCLMLGIYNAGDIVHHIIPLAPQNINDPNITLAWSNLRLLCRRCHGEIHRARERRYICDENGAIRF